MMTIVREFLRFLIKMVVEAISRNEVAPITIPHPAIPTVSPQPVAPLAPPAPGTRSAILTRPRGWRTSTGPIISQLRTDSGFQCLILERPAIIAEHPCIQLWKGLCKWTKHPEHGWCYELQDVLGRTAILIHGANVYVQLLGCLATGRARALFQPNSCHPGVPPVAMYGVTESDEVLLELQDDMKDAAGNDAPFMLTITEEV